MARRDLVADRSAVNDPHVTWIKIDLVTRRAALRRPLVPPAKGAADSTFQDNFAALFWVDPTKQAFAALTE